MRIIKWAALVMYSPVALAAFLVSCVWDAVRETAASTRHTWNQWRMETHDLCEHLSMLAEWASANADKNTDGGRG